MDAVERAAWVLDAAAEMIAIHTPDLINEGPNGEDDGKHWYCVDCGVLTNPAPSYGAEHVADVLAERGLLADTTCRSCSGTGGTDLGGARCAVCQGSGHRRAEQ